MVLLLNHILYLCKPATKEFFVLILMKDISSLITKGILLVCCTLHRVLASLLYRFVAHEPLQRSSCCLDYSLCHQNASIIVDVLVPSNLTKNVMLQETK